MKTLTILFCFAGILWVQSGFALTTLNIPVTDVYENPLDNLAIKSDQLIPSSEVFRKTPKKTTQKDSSDTIVIDLSEVVITSPFPENSRKCILEQVPYPTFAQEELLEGCVTARFAFDEAGKVHVLEANATDPRLDNYVRSKLESLQLSYCMVEIGKDYYLRFWFKLY